MSETSDDGFLGGRLTIRQSKSGFRAGIDAVLVAAAVPVRSGEAALELGSGNGVASLCVCARTPGCDVTGVECDDELVALANDNARRNAFTDQVRFVKGDIRDLPQQQRREYAHVFCNPPFYRETLPRSPNPVRARASHDEEGLADWIRQGLARTVSNGTFTLILGADRIPDVLVHAPQNGGSIFPLWPHAGEPAKRVIVQIRKSSAAPWQLLAGMVLHEASGGYTHAAQQILQGESAIGFAARTERGTT